MRNPKYKNGFKITTHNKSLLEPFKWKKSQMVFVNSMSDIFHESIDDDFILRVFEIMNNTPQHNYQILTKRTKRLLEISDRITWTQNIWIGATIECDKYIDRIMDIKKIPARIKFLSCEPLLSPIHNIDLQGINWVIVGGESGSNSRIVRKSWVEDLKNQCDNLKIPFFFKQWGNKKNNPDKNDPTLLAKDTNHAKGGCQLNGEIFHEFPIILNM
jgi:protein gp37